MKLPIDFPGGGSVPLGEVADLFEPFTDVGRVGYECRIREEVWEIGLYLGCTEFVGGKLDGEIQAVDFQFDVARLYRMFDQIARFRPTFLTSVPTMINNMLRSPRMDAADLSCLRVCLSAGEALPPALYDEWKRRTGVEILDGIGSAEMFHIYISNRLGDVRPGSLGKVVPGYEAEIVGDDGRAVPDGEPGRLKVGGVLYISYNTHPGWAAMVPLRHIMTHHAEVMGAPGQGY